MREFKANIFPNFNYQKDFGEKLFLAGIFFLASVPFIGFILLLISLVLAIRSKPQINFNDKWNIPIFLSVGIIFFNTIYITLINKPNELESFSNSLIWINLCNWIPMFIGFIWFQYYLNTQQKRINFSKSIIAGSIPILFSCFMQLFFKWNGPKEILNGLIIWFLKPVELSGGITGLFSNTNYTGLWLSAILPFSLFLVDLNKRNKNLIKRYLVYAILVLITFFILSTNSRNALFGSFVAFNIIFGINKIILISLAILLLLALVYFSTSFVNIEFIKNFIPKILFSKIIDLKFLWITPRIIIWKNAIIFILLRPIFGWGSGTFSYLHSQKAIFWSRPIKNFEYSHAHNLFFEISHNFGLPLSFLLTFTFIYLMISAFRKIFYYESINKNSNFDKYWLASGTVIILSHFYDITYYDGRIALLFCIILSGTRSILNDYKGKKIL